MLKNILIVIVSGLHLYFFILESFLWTKPTGLKVFRMNSIEAETKKVLAFNQGVYNLFLAAGLVWSLLNINLDFRYQLQIFFLGCVIVAGIVGAKTASKKIFFIQALPAIVALILVIF